MCVCPGARPRNARGVCVFPGVWVPGSGRRGEGLRNWARHLKVRSPAGYLKAFFWALAKKRPAGDPRSAAEHWAGQRAVAQRSPDQTEARRHAQGEHPRHGGRGRAERSER